MYGNKKNKKAIRISIARNLPMCSECTFPDTPPPTGMSSFVATMCSECTFLDTPPPHTGRSTFVATMCSECTFPDTPPPPPTSMSEHFCSNNPPPPPTSMSEHFCSNNVLRVHFPGHQPHLHRRTLFGVSHLISERYCCYSLPPRPQPTSDQRYLHPITGQTQYTIKN